MKNVHEEALTDSQRSFYDVSISQSNHPNMLASSQDEFKDISNKRRLIELRRNRGKQYTNRAGNVVQKRVMTRMTPCRMGCCNKVSLEDQSRLFDEYWNLGSYNLRVTYMQQLINVVPTKRNRSKLNIKSRKFTVTYSLNVEAEKVKVCMKCFLLTFGETHNFVNQIANKLWDSMSDIVINKRKNRIPKNKTPTCKVEEVNQHIKKFPAYESHYARSHTAKKYLPVGMNCKLMYRFYCQDTDKPVSYKIYYAIFKKTGLKFKPRQLDTCNKCDEFASILKYESDIEKKKEIEALKEKHQLLAASSYEEKKKDKKLCLEANEKKLLTFDLQPCLATPQLDTSVSFYKRPLWTFNLTVNSPSSNTKCFMWHESVASRGGNEIASCLYKYLTEVDSSITHITMFSDCCRGQNKNKIMAAMALAFVAQGNIQCLDHKFLEPGHTHMECDSYHALIEKAKKKYKMKIEHPNDWYDLVRSVRLTPGKEYEVVEMTQGDFLDFNSLFKSTFTMRSHNEEKEKFLWKNVKWIRYHKNHAGKILYKQNFSDEEFSILNVRKQGRTSYSLKNLKQCYTHPLPISEEKKKDLLSVLNLIRPEVRDFYKELPTDKTLPTIDFDISDTEDNE